MSDETFYDALDEHWHYEVFDEDPAKAGFQNFADYISPPEQANPPQPDPLEVAKVQNDGKKADAALINAQSGADKNKRLSDMDAIKMQLEGSGPFR